MDSERTPTDVHQQADLVRARAMLTRAFQPSGPLGARDLFAGRVEQVQRVLGAITQPGQHVVLFGERGVGKTTLARFAHEFWAEDVADRDIIAVRYNCEPTDTFGSIWANVAELIADAYEKHGDPMPSGDTFTRLFTEVRDGLANPNSVRRMIDIADKVFIIVVDEFDQVTDQDTDSLFASTIKTLSDYLIESTLILVGVADTVDDLIGEHASIDRAMVQILMPRMSTAESTDIIRRGYDRAGMVASQSVITSMARFAQGLPYYAHVFGQEAGYAAVERQSIIVDSSDVDSAVAKAIENAHESVRMSYRLATTSPQKEALFSKVLLACALTRVGDLGFFAPADVREPLAQIAGKRYDIPQYIGHLKKFCSPDKGDILQVEGEEWKRRYRFSNPLVKPYVVLKGIQDGLIGEDTAAQLAPVDREPESGEQRHLL